MTSAGIQSKRQAARRAALRSLALLEFQWRRVQAGFTTIGVTAPLLGLLATAMEIVNSFVGAASERHALFLFTANRLSDALLPAALGLLVAVVARWCGQIVCSESEAHATLVGNQSVQLLAMFAPDQLPEIRKRPPLIPIAWAPYYCAAAASRVHREMTRRLAVLATVSAVAPFIGLLGTILELAEVFRGYSNEQWAQFLPMEDDVMAAFVILALSLSTALPARWCYRRLVVESELMREEMRVIALNVTDCLMRATSRSPRS